MSKAPLAFTIAIPTYNNARTLGKTVESAIGQSFKGGFEVLVVNNNSQDDTLKVLESYKGDIRLINNPATVSMYENHNICIREAQGDYIVFCHSDDQLLSDALDKFHLILQSRGFPERYVIWGRSMFRDFFPEWKRSELPVDHPISGEYALNVFLEGGLTPSGTCYSRKSFASVGGFIITNHPMAAADLTTMWCLALNFFEFEMSGRVFFRRMEATISRKKTFSDRVDSLEDTFIAFLGRSSEAEQSVIKEILQGRIIGSLAYRMAAAKVGLVEANSVLSGELQPILRNPFLLLRKRNLKRLFQSFKFSMAGVNLPKQP